MRPESFLLEHGIDRRWLEARLVAVGAAAAGAELEGWSAAIIGTGQVGENVRCRLSWRGEGPTSVVIKLPSSSEVSRAAAAATRTYIREVGFYRDVRDRVAIRTPTPLFLSEDRPANRFVLVMEDITPAVQGDQLRGCTPDQARLAMEAVAGLHGPTWGHRELLELDWVDQPTDASLAERVTLYRSLYPGFADRYAGALTPDELAIGRWLGDAIADLLVANHGDRCLVHGDFRLDNLLFGTGPGAPPVTTVDWQTASFGFGLSDIAYLLSAGLTPADRRANEAQLLEAYRVALGSHGVALDPDNLYRGYRLGSASGYTMAVIASQIVERTERGDAMFVAMARGAAGQMVDVDLPGLVA